MHQLIQSSEDEHGFLCPQSIKHNGRTFLPEFFSRQWGFPTCLTISFLPVLFICIFATPAFYTVDDVIQAMYPEGGALWADFISHALHTCSNQCATRIAGENFPQFAGFCALPAIFHSCFHNIHGSSRIWSDQ